MAEDADRHIAVMEDDMELPFAVGSSLEEQPPPHHLYQNTSTMERCRFESSAGVLPPLISSSSSSSATSRNIPELESSVLSASEEEVVEEESSHQQPPPQQRQPQRRQTIISRPSIDTSTLSEEFLDAAASLLWFPESSLAEQPLLIPSHQQQSPIITRSSPAASLSRIRSTKPQNHHNHCPITIQCHPQQPLQPQHDAESGGVAVADDDDEEQTQRIDNRRTEDESIASSTSSSYSPSILSSSSSPSSLMLGLVVNGEQSHHMSNGPHTATTIITRHRQDGLLLPNPSWHSSTPMIVSTLAGVSAQIISDDSFVVRVWITTTTTTTTTLPQDGEDRNTRLLLLSELTIPQHWKHWCEAIQGFVVVVSQSSSLDVAVGMAANSTTATRPHDSNRAYDGVWIDATVGPLRSPNSNTSSSCCHTTALWEYSKRMLGCPTFGRLSLFHDIPNQTISATLGPFPGHWEQRYQLKFRPNSPCNHNNNHDGRFLLETTVRIKRLHHNENIPLGCWDKYWQRRTLLQHRDQVMLSMARLKFWVENQHDHHQDETSRMQQWMTMSSSIPNDQYSTSNNYNHSLECPLLIQPQNYEKN